MDLVPKIYLVGVSSIFANMIPIPTKTVKRLFVFE